MLGNHAKHLGQEAVQLDLILPAPFFAQYLPSYWDTALAHNIVRWWQEILKISLSTIP